MNSELKNNISRRRFFKVAGEAAIATGVASGMLSACSNKEEVNTSGAISEADVPKDKMTYRTNPNTGDRVSLLGYGMMRLPVEGGESAPPDAPIDQELVNKEIDFALEHGVNYIDTSPVYCQGRSERATGIALSRHPRDKYLIATKLSNFDPDTWPLEEGQKMFYNSLKELQVDYVDYLLLHAVGMGENGPEEFDHRYAENGLLDWLVEQKEAGKIRNLGFSYHGDISVFNNLLEWHDDGDYHWDFVQIELNYIDWKHANEINKDNTNAEYLYNELKKRDIPAIIMEPLLGGRLANLPDAIVAEMKRRDPKSSVASWAFRFAGTPDGVLTVLSGMTYMDHLMENIITYSPLRPITPKEEQFLENIAKKFVALPLVPCNDCKYCMPCPYGLDIPAIFKHYNKCIKEGNLIKDENDSEYKKARKVFLVGYDRSVPKLRQANHCISCRHCVNVKHCPQEIDIPKELKRIDDFVEQLKQSDKKD
ncbi:MAG: aldo/keto reductase [Muribaculaceae bacterium]|nr:aldo/keto reductase [Muribaculaceae bacterium]